MSIERRYLHTLIVKRNVPSAGDAAETPGGASTTLTADVAPGAEILAVAAATGIAAGDWLRVGDLGETEIRQVALGGVVGLAVTLTAPLRLAHDSGDEVREVQNAGTPDEDEYGQPVVVPTTVATVRGLIQPKSAREVALTSEAGVVQSDHLGFMAPLSGLTTGDWLERDGRRYDIVAIADAAGLGHHLELDLKAVT